jgi:hypothetical protein
MILDDIFLLDRPKLFAICDGMIGEKMGLKWYCLSHIRFMTEDRLRKIKQAGCWIMEVGIESGCERILRLLKRNMTKVEIAEAESQKGRHPGERQLYLWAANGDPGFTYGNDDVCQVDRYFLLSAEFLERFSRVRAVPECGEVWLRREGLGKAVSLENLLCPLRTDQRRPVEGFENGLPEVLPKAENRAGDLALGQFLARLAVDGSGIAGLPPQSHQEELGMLGGAGTPK